MQTNEKYKKFPNSNSQANQESFVLHTLKEKRKGYYVEIGSYHFKEINNTYLLEKEYGWKGVGFEISKDIANMYNQNRINPCINANAITFDYKNYFIKNNFPKQIDYLQLDIDPPLNTLKCLKNLPLDDYRFTIITFEHDLYANKNENIAIKKESQEIFLKYGYRLVYEDVCFEGTDLQFEDWWVDPNIISPTNQIFKIYI